MKRRHCSPSYHQDNLYNDVCDVSYETICTTIIATKYVKVSLLVTGGQDVITASPNRAVLI